MSSATHEDFLNLVFNKKYHSVFIGIVGPNQAGKSVMALWMATRSIELGLFDWFGTNIPDIKLPFPHDFIEDLPTLKERCESLGANGTHRYLFLADEMGVWAPKDQPWLNIKIIEELQEVRKYGLSLIGCGIDRIDSRILHPSFFMGKIEKRSKAHPDKAIYYNWEHYPVIKKYRIHNIPNLQVQGFNTYRRAKFYMEKQHPGIREYEPEFVKIYRDYLQAGKSWKAIGVHPQKGKRAKAKLLAYLWEKYCENDLAGIEGEQITESQIAR